VIAETESGAAKAGVTKTGLRTERLLLYFFVFICVYLLYFLCYHKLVNEDLYYLPLAAPARAAHVAEIGVR